MGNIPKDMREYYARAYLMSVLSTALMASEYSALQKRHRDMVIACSSVAASFERYKQRVKETYLDMASKTKPHPTTPYVVMGWNWDS